MTENSIAKEAPLRQLRSLAGAGGVLFLLTLLIALTVIPWATGLVVDAQHVYLAEVPQANRGAYLVTDQGAMQLYNWHLPLADLPSDAPVVAAADVQVLSVVMKQLDAPDAYLLYCLNAGTIVAWRAAWREGRQLLLDPGWLPPGDYLLAIPTDDMFGGKTYHYFGLR